MYEFHSHIIHYEDPENAELLEQIETCLFLVCFDKPLPATYNRSEAVNEGERDEANIASQMLHGGGSEFNSGNRWFDKTMQVIIQLFP
jgi:choline O-acetyltransferase